MGATSYVRIGRGMRRDQSLPRMAQASSDEIKGKHTRIYVSGGDISRLCRTVDRGRGPLLRLCLDDDWGVRLAWGGGTGRLVRWKC